MFIAAGKASTLFAAAYPDFMTLVRDFSEKLRDFLPDNYDISKHIYEVSGTYFG